VAKKPPPEDEGPSQEWLASYADAMTLLLAFFIMMFAFALIDEGKYFDFKVGVMAALGVPDPLTDNTDSILSKGTGITPEIGLTPLSQSPAEAEAEMELREALEAAGLITPVNAEELEKLLESRFKAAGAAEYVDVGIDERGVYIRFDGRVLFPSGQATLDEEGLTLLATAADVLQIIDNPLEVEGHTDSQPTNGTSWPSNWELSTARSSRVVRWMIEPGNIPATRLTAVGLADTKPRSNNNTAEGRQENRRVEIVTRVVDNSAALGSGTATGDGAADPAADGPGTGETGTGQDGTTGDPAVDGAGTGDATGAGDPAADGSDPIVLDPGQGGDGTATGDGGGSDSETIDPIGDPLQINP
jgi:chemotaxis protein MotB